MVPVQVAGGEEFTAISGEGRACAPDTRGRAWCWDTLGDGAVGNSTPQAVPGGHQFTAITGDGYGLDTLGRALRSGSASSKDEDPVPGPPRVVPSHEFSAISAGGAPMCGLDPEGRAWCWGFNDYGELGIGHVTDEETDAPVAVVGGHTFAAISAGSNHVCALDRSGTPWCWGEDAAFGGALMPVGKDRPVRIHFQ